MLQILYDNLEHKERVLVHKRVVGIETTNGGVLVKTQDGDSFAGDIIAGCDGVHSSVRREMHRLGTEKSPNYFPKGEEAGK